jgi:PhzF family phenazine biosynthesis protein
MMTQNRPVFGNFLEDRGEVSRLLGLTQDDIGDTPVQVVSTGVKKLVVPVKDLNILRKIKPDLTSIIKHAEANDYSGVAVISPEPFTNDGDLATRNFSPSVGINEDPATGIAAGPIGCYADKYIYDGKKKRIIIEQGFDMGKSSTLYVDIADGVKVGGYAAYFGEEDLETENI